MSLQPLIDWLYRAWQAFYDWYLDVALWVPRKVWSEVLDASASAMEALPVPDFVSHAQSFFNGIPSSIVYFFQFFAIQEGLAFITTALILRFLLRRIPIIG